MLIRHPRPEEMAEIRAFVQRVVDDTYGDIPIDDSDWSLGWIALSKATIAGFVLTSADSIDDLWIATDARGRGIGTALLSRGEQEISERGFSTARLRVVASNEHALRFYAKRGWTQVRSFPHETLHLTMIDHEKLL